MKPIKGKYGFLQGICSRCGEDDLPLIRLNSEAVCDTCANVIDRSKKSKVKIKETDEEQEFIDRIVNG